MAWELKRISKVKMKDPILIEGLPGMGNVGKIVVDYMIDALHAEKMYEMYSYDLPHCVFVNEENVVELPSVSVYYKNLGKRTLLLLAGDIQPPNENSCYEFCNTVLDTLEKANAKEIITLGGIGLASVPKNPRVFCTGNSKKVLMKYKSPLISPNVYGVVGPIVGVSGLLPGLAARRNIPAVALLAETFAHPGYLGVSGAKNVLKILKKELKLNIEVDALGEEITEGFASEKLKKGRASEVLRKINMGNNAVLGKGGADYIG